ncbi:MAG: hypothetical protein IJT06_04430 [Selenomonadaceae bacterium]|nr:hypothetical protein [Selenomonadaceae bacterium]
MENFFDLQRFDDTPPTPPDGDNGGTPPDMPSGEGEGGTPPDSSGGGNSSGGNSSSSVTWSGATEITSAGTYNDQTFTSTSSNQNALLINTSEDVTLNNVTVTKTGGDSAGDEQSFYGTNSGVLAKGGTTTTIDGGTITTDAAGANGVFSYGGNGGQNGADGDGTTITISNAKITTTGDGSGGIMTTGGGVTFAENLTIETSGQSSAAIRTDRGGGTVNVTGGSYTSNGLGSPAIYSTAEIVVNSAELTSNKSEGVCIEGKNSVTLNNCTLTANNTQTNGQATFLDGVMIYQSMSGDSAEGTSTFTMNGGTLNNKSGHVFHVTNTNAVINLNNVTINNEDSNGVFLSVSADGWSGGSNVATLNASGQNITGNILVGSDSTLTLNLTDGAAFFGAISGNVTNAAGSVISNSVGTVNVTLDDNCKWHLSGDAYVTSFSGDAANVINNGYSLYVNNTILEGTTVNEETTAETTLPSGLTFNAEKTEITASSEFSGVVNLTEYENVTTFDGSEATNSVIVIGNSLDNSINGGGGVDRLFGAFATNTLTGGDSQDQFWFDGSGNALVTDFVAGNSGSADIVTFYGINLQNVVRVDSMLSFTSESGATINLMTNTQGSDDVFLYTLDGTTAYGAKVSKDTDNWFTYDSSVNYYRMNGAGGTLYADYDDAKEIWLDNSSGKYFFGIDNVVMNNSGDNVIGGNANPNLIIGGNGNNSLWGGAGDAADTLQGGSSSDLISYGYGEGNDVILNVDENDAIVFYNISLNQITDTWVDDEKISVTIDNWHTLTVDSDDENSPFFGLADGSVYQYSRSSGSWQQRNVQTESQS